MTISYMQTRSFINRDLKILRQSLCVYVNFYYISCSVVSVLQEMHKQHKMTWCFMYFLRILISFLHLSFNSLKPKTMQFIHSVIPFILHMFHVDDSLFMIYSQVRLHPSRKSIIAKGVSSKRFKYQFIMRFLHYSYICAIECNNANGNRKQNRGSLCTEFQPR